MALVYTFDEGPDQSVVELATTNRDVVRSRMRTLDSDLVLNASIVSGTTVSDALDTLGTATILPNGYVSRHVYVNAASTMIGQSFAGVTIEAAVTWTTPEDVPPGNYLDFDLGAGGGGGGGGHLDTSIARTGGGGAGGGARPPTWSYARADVLAMLPLVISVGLGGAGGLGLIMTGAVVTRASTDGANGGDTTVGPMGAFGGGGGPTGRGVGGVRGGGTGGGMISAGDVASLVPNAAAVGGAPLTITPSSYGGTQANADLIVTDYGGAGHVSYGVDTLIQVGSSASVWGGASGAPGGNATPNVFAAGGQSKYGGGGGGSGGGGTITPGQSSPGSDGGGRLTAATRRGGGGLGGASSGTNGVPASPGAPGAAGDAWHAGDGGGGGGGHTGNNFVSGPGNTAGAGGAGGFPCGAAGGGGAFRLQASAGVVNTCGDGARGGDGFVMVTGRL